MAVDGESLEDDGRACDFVYRSAVFFGHTVYDLTSGDIKFPGYGIASASIATVIDTAAIYIRHT